MAQGYTKKKPTAPLISQSQRTKQAVLQVKQRYGFLTADAQQYNKLVRDLEESPEREAKLRPKVEKQRQQIDESLYFYHEAIKCLIRLDNNFLLHPQIQRAMEGIHLSGKKELRRLHRGLEVGIKGDLKDWEYAILRMKLDLKGTTVVDAIDEEESAPWIQKVLKTALNRELRKSLGEAEKKTLQQAREKIEAKNRQGFEQWLERFSVRFSEFSPTFNKAALPQGPAPNYVKNTSLGAE